MEREDLLALAQQGQTTAIAALLNQQLKYRGMRCRVLLRDHVLHVVVSAEGETPDRGATLEFLRAKIINLDIEALTRVRLYGLAPDTDTTKAHHPTASGMTPNTTSDATPDGIPDHPRWTQEFALAVGDYSLLAAGSVREDHGSQSSTPLPIATTPDRHRSHRQPTTSSLAIVAITLGLVIFSGYKLIARNTRSGSTPPAISDPAPPANPTP
ncbi:MAG: hypothetical protein EAZ61_06955 [Oscillatoriales cyanobacterium]|nr:MAG: hypothetical protein EAZ61_06955 [Oscillatoriales cyanobacterium]